MDLEEGIVLSEVSLTKKDKYCVVSHMWNLTVKVVTKNRLIDTRANSWLPEEWWGGARQE